MLGLALLVALPFPATGQQETLLVSAGRGGSYTFQKPTLRMYDKQGKLAVVVWGEEATSAGGVHLIKGARYSMLLPRNERTERDRSAPDRGALRIIKGEAARARYDMQTDSVLFEGDVVVRLYAGQPGEPMDVTGRTATTPLAIVRVARLRLRYDRDHPRYMEITAAGRVWALFFTEGGTTELTGQGLQIGLHDRSLAIGSDVEFLISGDLLATRGLFTAEKPEVTVHVERGEGEPPGKGAIVTARRGVRLSGLGEQVVAGDKPKRNVNDARPPAPARDIHFFGPVSVIQDGLRLSCDDLRIHSEAGRLAKVVADGRVRFRAVQRNSARLAPTSAAVSAEFLGEGRRAVWELTPGGERPSGVLTLTGPREDPAEIVRRQAGEPPQWLVARTIRVNLETGAYTSSDEPARDDSQR